MTNRYKIMIIEDQALLNNMIKKTLEEYYDVVCTCSCAKDMMSLYKKYTPDLILTDVVTLNGANGIEYARDVKEKYGNKVKILAITGIPEITFLNMARSYNLDGLIYKDIDSESLLFSIREVLKGYTLFPGNYVYNKENEKFKNLSSKEIKIIKYLCEARDRDEIAEELNITLGTLKNYITNILTKLEFDSISKLTIFCLSNGYIVPNQKK
ncbi:MAG: response regulator transcription factor [Bacilli bacterium]|nr:response regulator transcription factor [Bacilli bacterium]